MPKNLACWNCNSSREVSVSIPCPECQSKLGITLHDNSLAMFKLLEEWASTLYWQKENKAKMASLAYRTGLMVGKIADARNSSGGNLYKN